MTQDELIIAIRSGLSKDAAYPFIESLIDRGIMYFGLLLKQKDDTFLSKRISISSNTNIFPFPSGLTSVKRVWDLEGNAKTITDATNASPINIESVAHGFVTADVVLTHDILGNTDANGTWAITVIDDDNFTLDGSTGNADYVSGGKVYVEPTTQVEIKKVETGTTNQDNDNRWYPRGRSMVINDVNFVNDIVIDYRANPTIIGDIPAEYHEGIIAFVIITIDKEPSQIYVEIFNSIKNLIQTTFKQSDEPSRTRDVL